MAPIDNVYGTLGVIKATSTQSYSDNAKLREEIEGSGSYTFFAPSNDAWDALDEVRLAQEGKQNTPNNGNPFIGLGTNPPSLCSGAGNEERPG